MRLSALSADFLPQKLRVLSFYSIAFYSILLLCKPLRALNAILTFTSAPAAFKVKVSSYFTYELTDFKTRKKRQFYCA